MGNALGFGHNGGFFYCRAYVFYCENIGEEPMHKLYFHPQCICYIYIARVGEAIINELEIRFLANAIMDVLRIVCP